MEGGWRSLTLCFSSLRVLLGDIGRWNYTPDRLSWSVSYYVYIVLSLLLIPRNRRGKLSCLKGQAFTLYTTNSSAEPLDSVPKVRPITYWWWKPRSRVAVSSFLERGFFWFITDLPWSFLFFSLVPSDWILTRAELTVLKRMSSSLSVINIHIIWGLIYFFPVYQAWRNYFPPEKVFPF